ncbi:PPE domain-containing protein [Mycobacterium sp. OAE908]|uniref:colicin D domain-containing protein n=1 Tax=Mycobacterium sp. OAE908 TaxID=2817899 RepID=UPI001AE601C1
MPVLPPMPHQPPIAIIPEPPAPPSIGGEQFSKDLHSGPGSGDLRDFSRAWHNYSQDITHAADDTRSVAMKVTDHWSTGDVAANNIMDHAKWLDSAAAWAERLSVEAEGVAHAFDIAKENTPTPDEFADAESDVMKAAALMAVSPAIGMIEYQQATSRYAELVTKAEDAEKQYHAAVSDALTGVGHPIAPCPPIATQSDIPSPPMEPQLGPGVKLAPETPLIIARSQIEAKFKHAQDFGVTEPRGKAGFDAFENAVQEQVSDPATMHIAGTYRGDPAILNYNPSTGTVVVQSPTGEFISGWRVSQAQATNILNQGKLGGG